MSNNPWIRILSHPRETVAGIASKDPKKALWWLAAIYGFSSVLNAFQTLELGHNLSLLFIFVLAAILAPFLGYINISIWSWVVSLTGKWLKGAADFQTVRCAYAWSCVPLIVNIPLWILLALFFGPQLFINFGEQTLLTNHQATLLFLILLCRIATVVWSLVIYINALAEVQQFSVLRAIGNILLSGLLILLVMYLIITLVYYITQPMPHATTIFFNLSQTLRYL